RSGQPARRAQLVQQDGTATGCVREHKLARLANVRKDETRAIGRPVWFIGNAAFNQSARKPFADRRPVLNSSPSALTRGGEQKMRAGRRKVWPPRNATTRYQGAHSAIQK